ncbi:MAG: type II toxin-antitoxin system HicA family toxin [Planctomycetota bacterium]|jgi:predicted RNA binding protein YcfA (HicA-like mRNA interferase family)|nr:type II toxin-antitoxin system HicA family toxin [Planctomycetota bacterium]
MPLTGKAMLKLYLQNGWIIDRINGSHYIVVKGRGRETIPVHSNRDLPKGTEGKLLKNLRSNQ